MMDSPSIDSPTTTTTASSAAAADTSSSAALPDSAIFGDIDKLSPITAVKASLATTGFSGLSSPIVFASPNLNPSEGSFSNRLQFPPLSSEKICQNDYGGNKINFESELISQNKSPSSSSLTHCQREYENGSRKDQFSTPANCFDKYLVDSVEVEYMNTKQSANYDLIQLNQYPNSQQKFESTDDVTQNADNAINSYPDMLQLGEHDFQENPYFNEKTSGKNTNNEGNEMCSSLKLQDPVPEHKDIADNPSEFLSQSINTVTGYQYESNAIGEVSCENYENEALHVFKGKRSHGLQRRRLQFEGADIENTPRSWNPSNAETARKSPCPLDLEVLEPPVPERTATNSDQPVSMISFMKINNPRSTISKPSGIGLHLNSIISSKPMCVSTGISVQGEKSVSCSDYYPQKSTNNGSISLKIGESFSTTSQNQEASDSHYSEYDSSNDPAFGDCQATPCDKKRKFTLEQVCEFEESSHSSPKKKSKKTSASSDGDGCKRCNCKKTKCLKLYCDCFAAGIYCADTCSCQGCLNRPDYVDTVLEVRKQIEIRNPLAFAPKIVERLIDSHVDSNRKEAISTPSSARHKRGCNCKKSMCMKKYCECYQNNVGCSSGCRCDGCQNIHGKKEDYHGAKDVFSVPISEAHDDKVELVPNKDYFLQNDPSNHHSITPMTPSFQFSIQGHDGLKSNFSARRYLSSPESDLSLMPNTGGSNGTIDNHNAPVNNNKKIDAISSHLEFNSGNDDILNVISPTDNGFTDIGNSNGQLGKAKIFKTGLQEKLDNILEDDTPEILKDPINCVKISSPNKKRISPPRICGLRQLGSSFSSAGLKSGRKFILRALPSFPPLTLCIDGKNSSSQKK